jgi:type III secretion protein U
MSDDKTEEPTDKKLRDAKDKGQSPKSPDVNAAAGLVAAVICLGAAGPASFDHLRKILRIVQERGITVQGDVELQGLALDIAKEGLLAVLPFVAAAVLTGIVASFAQVGVQISFEPLTPDFDKVNPGSGIKKVFSVKSLIDLVKMIAKATLLGVTAWVVCKDLLPLLVGAVMLSPEGVAQVAWEAVLKLLKASLGVFIVLGPADFALQKWQFMKDQRMSKDEVKRENKESEGDPETKGKRKQIAEEMAHEAPARRAVPGSSVVVANPTHFAVALRYVPGETPLPVVTAKGIDDHALEIRRVAEDCGVPVAVNPPLARALHKLPVGAAIPEQLFDAVAAVLRWVRNVEILACDLAEVPGTPPGSTP